MKEIKMIEQLAEENTEILTEGEREHRVGERIKLSDIFITEEEYKRMIDNWQRQLVSFINQGFKDPLIGMQAIAQPDGRLSFFNSAIALHGQRVECGVSFLDRFSWSTKQSDYRPHKINPDDFGNMLNKFEESSNKERELNEKLGRLSREIEEDKRIVETLRSGDRRYSIFFVDTDDFEPNPEYTELHTWDEFVKRADWNKWAIVHGEMGDYATEKKDLSKEDKYSAIEEYLKNKKK